MLLSIGANLTGHRRGSFACVRARTGDGRAGGRRISVVQDLLVSLRIAARTRVGAREMLRRPSLKLLIVSMDNRGKIVDGDVNARVRDSIKGGGVIVWLMADGREEGNMGGRGQIEGRRRGGGRSGATWKRTGSQMKEDGKVRMRLRGLGRAMCRKRDVLCADSMTAVESDRSCQCRVGRTERTGEEREDEGGHDMRGEGGRQKDMLNSSIIVNVSDLVHGLSTLSLSGRARAKQCKAGSGGKERDQDRVSIWRSLRKRSLILSPTSSLPKCLSTTQSTVSSSPQSVPPAPSPRPRLPTGPQRSNPLPPGPAVLVLSPLCLPQSPKSHLSQPVKSGSERMQTLKSYRISSSSRAFNSLP